VPVPYVIPQGVIISQETLILFLNSQKKLHKTVYSEYIIALLWEIQNARWSLVFDPQMFIGIEVFSCHSNYPLLIIIPYHQLPVQKPIWDSILVINSSLHVILQLIKKFFV